MIEADPPSRRTCARMLRDLANRIEASSDIDAAAIVFERQVEDISTPDDMARRIRAQRGRPDDETITVRLRLTPYADD